LAAPGSRRGYADLMPMGRELARHGYRVLLRDRRNCGASDVSIDGEGLAIADHRCIVRPK
jgi:pimeloyl-ACP methyl ester carboxylesterase